VSRPDGRHGGDAAVAWVTTGPARRNDPEEGRALGDEALTPPTLVEAPRGACGERRAGRRARSRGRRRGKEPQESSSPLGGGPLVESFEPPRTRRVGSTPARSKVEGGRAAAERRHGPRRGCSAARSADEVDTTARSERPHLRRGSRPPAPRGASPRWVSTAASRQGRPGKRAGSRGPEARSEQSSGGAKPRRAPARRARETGRREHGFVGGGRLRSRPSCRTEVSPVREAQGDGDCAARRARNGARAPVGIQATARGRGRR